ncbi:MAG: hypothetical protein JWN43_2531, partial [Gammaproteobacteria bacterium]|nr:hypothetical protein [Gammaproteobacteria bacterium]
MNPLFGIVCASVDIIDGVIRLAARLSGR